MYRDERSTKHKIVSVKFCILTDFPAVIPPVWRDSVNGCTEGTSVCGCGSRNSERSTGLWAEWWWIPGSCQPLLVAFLLLLCPVPSGRSSTCWPGSIGSVWSGAGEEAADLPSQVCQALVFCVCIVSCQEYQDDDVKMYFPIYFTTVQHVTDSNLTCHPPVFL